ncbi:heavy-metal-associated domain protein, putative copper metallochaperone CopZ [Campylobacter iguaniorum]|uniref:Heavy-metal-associated domain protein, putative copper metallochaperone CopZ n=1 Tax=Campylobacter iguaniorum TaxID=1244531 RepID=A0A076FEZ1_9BACT|nr:cation transporter [Campylobacter iguaniorum]AII14394.1 heavy-metal-associated domain protein, putative copper metallochaperone CopZ [Campylobacter iguaniorum]
MKKFEVNNVHCMNCANIIKNSLEDDFGHINVDLNAEPKIVSLELNDSQVEEFKKELDELGFSVIKEIK